MSAIIGRSYVEKALVIVPTYNEAANIGPLLSRIFAATSAVEVLFVDDASPDGTLHEINEAKVRFPGRVHCLERAGKLGLGSAYIAGFRWALARDYGFVIEMDADLSHDPQYLPVMLETLKRYDVAVGSRYVFGGGTRNWGLWRRIISRLGSLYAQIILAQAVQDFTGGFNGWRRRVLERLDLDYIGSEGYAFQIELKYRALQAGFRLKEFPIVFADRRVGQSKMSKSIVYEAIWRVIAIRSSALRLSESITAIDSPKISKGSPT
jgi:dolichol-phosphate mannosyltransferase